MNKNIAIGMLVVLVLGFGFYLIKNNGVVAPVDNTSTNGNYTNQPVNQNNPSPQPDVPIVQTNQKTFISSSTAALSGTVNPNGASTKYWFDYGESTAFGNQSASQAIGSGYTSIPATGFITSLRANTLYYFRLNASNEFGVVYGEMFSVQTNSNTPPKVVITVVRTAGATEISRTTATINGQVNPNGTATSYWYEYGTSNNLGYVTNFQNTNAGITFMPVPASISNLQPLTKYYFRLNAQNQFGTVNGTVMNFTTLGPVASSKPTVETSNATNISSTDATFVGNINPNGSSTTYWFEYSNDSSLNNLIGTGTPRGIVNGNTSVVEQINVNALQSNTKYYYRLVGTNDNGKVSGNIVSFTTKK